MQASLGLLADLAAAVPCEELHFVPDPAVIDLLMEARMTESVPAAAGVRQRR